jgi:hypothetical protein
MTLGADAALHPMVRIGDGVLCKHPELLSRNLQGNAETQRVARPHRPDASREVGLAVEAKRECHAGRGVYVECLPHLVGLGDAPYAGFRLVELGLVRPGAHGKDVHRARILTRQSQPNPFQRRDLILWHRKLEAVGLDLSVSVERCPADELQLRPEPTNQVERLGWIGRPGPDDDHRPIHGPPTGNLGRQDSGQLPAIRRPVSLVHAQSQGARFPGDLGGLHRQQGVRAWIGVRSPLRLRLIEAPLDGLWLVRRHFGAHDG